MPQSVSLDPSFGKSQISSSSNSVKDNTFLNSGSSPIINSDINNQIIHKSFPSYNWDLKFSGYSFLSFSAFLQRVDELSKSQQVTKNDLFLAAHDLSLGDGLNYYHLCKKSGYLV